MSLIRRRKITKRQARQIEQNQNALPDNDSLLTGIIISHFGKQLDVQITALAQTLEYTKKPVLIGDVFRCHARTNLPMLTAGDCVKFSLKDSNEFGRIEILLDRKTLITRPDRYHKIKPVAANADLMAIVFAPLPKPAVNLIDRYLLIAKLSGIAPLLILNKSDILQDYPDVQNIVDDYQLLGNQFGFNVIKTSSIDGSNLDSLKNNIHNKLTIFCGQSGVGKSSLINQLLPNANQPTNHISINSKLGQHTTTTSRLLAYNPKDLSQGGVIDTPGIREYGIWHLSDADILAGFDELNTLSGQCKFRDCSHQKTAKGCAFWAAAKEGLVLPRRIESLIELINEAKNGLNNSKFMAK